ncbi:Uncharacterised protein [Comamonas terrigena]|nr:Uncharacterised protein [Comamonas terrigena]
MSRSLLSLDHQALLPCSTGLALSPCSTSQGLQTRGVFCNAEPQGQTPTVLGNADDSCAAAVFAFPGTTLRPRKRFATCVSKGAEHNRRAAHPSLQRIDNGLPRPKPSAAATGTAAALRSPMGHTLRGVMPQRSAWKARTSAAARRTPVAARWVWLARAVAPWPAARPPAGPASCAACRTPGAGWHRKPAHRPLRTAGWPR